MAKKLRIQAQQTKTIAEAFSDFLLCKKALGISDKTLKTYSQHFSAVCKYLDSSAPIAGLFKRPLDEMIEQMRSSNLKDTSINSYTRTLKSFLSWCIWIVSYGIDSFISSIRPQSDGSAAIGSLSFRHSRFPFSSVFA